jgi:hypothetical protein
VDPDPQGSALILDLDTDSGEQNDPKENRKKQIYCNLIFTQY